MLLWVLPTLSGAQENNIERYCDVYATHYTEKIEKIVRFFKLPFISAERLPGKAKCPNGDMLEIKTPCVGDYQVAIISISGKNAKTGPAKVTKLFSVYNKVEGENVPAKCKLKEE